MGGGCDAATLARWHGRGTARRLHMQHFATPLPLDSSIYFYNADTAAERGGSKYSSAVRRGKSYPTLPVVPTLYFILFFISADFIWGGVCGLVV